MPASLPAVWMDKRTSLKTGYNSLVGAHPDAAASIQQLLKVLCLGYRFGGPVSIPSTTKKLVVLERGPFSLVSTTEELLDRKVAAPV
jgi:hypothetical protein